MMTEEMYKFSTRRGEDVLSYLKISENGDDKRFFYLNDTKISMQHRYSYKRIASQKYFMKVVLKEFNTLFER